MRADHADEVVSIPSMSLNDSVIFMQAVGQYNRGLCTFSEMIEELNRKITDIGGPDGYRFTDQLHADLRFKFCLEPYFHPTAYNGDRIAFRVHYADYTA